ncbi:MAG: polyprenol monophosphomannose synthase [Flavobacteriaceae bacterium]|nr:polyprenol monophosphomannose synthase [Flavobacteriaceae bacterium]MDG2315225.1 polyprenol monophosphomannose synthase [Flavobacteriaceae bacterium]
MSKALVIIPTFNEAENIVLMLEAIMNLPEYFSVLVVDDNSPDGTAVLVENFMKSYSDRIFIVKRAKKEGLGVAYIAGFRWALQRAYSFIFEMDADFSHNPKDLSRLLAPLSANQTDMVVGSRYAKGIHVVNWPLLRILISYGASVYARLVTGIPIKDTTSGFVGYRREVLEALNFDKIQFVGYAFQIELKFKTWKKQFRFVEIPIIFTDRVRGDSKMNTSIISEAVFGIIEMKIRSFFNKNDRASS